MPELCSELWGMVLAYAVRRGDYSIFHFAWLHSRTYELSIPYMREWGSRSSLSAVELAIRKLLDGVAGAPCTPPCRFLAGWWGEAISDSGIPCRVPLQSDWFNFRQFHFSRRRTRSLETFTQYGGIENLNRFGAGNRWKEMLSTLVSNEVARNRLLDSEERPFAVVLVKTAAGLEYLRRIHASEDVLERFESIPDTTEDAPAA